MIDRQINWTSYDQASSIRRYPVVNNKVDFDYGPNRERLRRLDYNSAGATTATTATHFVGAAEIRYNASNDSIEEVRRYLGGMLIVQSGTTIRREYFLTDAQGSTYAVLDDWGMPINSSARMNLDRLALTL